MNPLPADDSHVMASLIFPKNLEKCYLSSAAVMIESAAVMIALYLDQHMKMALIAVILLPAHPASFAHKFLFQRVPGCNSMADLSLKIVFWTH